MSIKTDDIDKFLCDENYLSLVESAREQRLLFITKMSETRVSAFLGWMFRPHEGHGLGDQAIRELLHNAWIQVNSDEWLGKSIEELGLNKWAPSCITTKSFRDLCVETEYRFGGKDSESKKQCAVDIVLVSRSNKLVILIENKFGSKVHNDQLKVYRRQAEKSFKGYQIFYIYLDPNENKIDDDHWVSLNYDWLIDLIDVWKQSGLLSSHALDALSQVKDYLKQESDELILEKQSQIAELVDKHKKILEEMKIFSRMKPHDRLTVKAKDNGSSLECLLIEYHQRKELWDDIFNQMGYISLFEAIKKKMGNKFDELEIRKLTKRLLVRSIHWAEIRNKGAKKEAAWGIRFVIWREENAGNNYNFRTSINFRSIDSIEGAKIPPYTPDQEKSLRELASNLRQMKKRSSVDSKGIRLFQKNSLSKTDIVELIIKEKNRIDSALKEYELLKEKE